MAPMPAFALGAAPVALRAGLSSVCGTRAPAAAAAAAHAPARGVRMSGEYGITLQTLLYEPNPSAPLATEDKDLMVTRIYRQVFGNAYIMEEEVAGLYKAQSMFRAGEITVKEFVRACALSETYRRRFFSCCGAYRAVELNFKHLLGRGPTTQAEISEHVRRTIEEGYEADINSYIDSMEYEQRFGDYTVPGITFKGTYTSSADFNNMCSMYSSPGTTDKSLTGRARTMGTANSNHVLSLDGAGVPSKTVALAAGYPASSVRVKAAIPSRPDLDLGIDSNAGLIKPPVPGANPAGAQRTRVEIAMGNYMYLTPEEAKAYNRQALEEKVNVGMVQNEAAMANAEIARLQARVKKLSAVV